MKITTGNCAHCGEPFQAKSAKRRYCSKKCVSAHHDAKNRALRLAARPPRTCRHCDGQIPTAKPEGTLYCSPECRTAFHVELDKRPEARKARLARVHQRRFDAKANRPPCKNCGVPIPQEAIATKQFCGNACRREYDNDTAKAKRLDAKVDRPCPECGGTISRQKLSYSQYCSHKCASRANNQRRVAREHWPDADYISKIAVARRDEFVCHICGEKPAWDDLTLDHVVPLSKGGLHSPENLKVACHSCNSAKADKQLSAGV